MKRTINMVNVAGQWVAVQAKKKSTALVAGGTAMISSAGAFAADHTGIITTAATEGNGNVTAVITAVIGIAILSFGVGAMIAWFRK